VLSLKNKIVVILGRKGSGKSTLAREVVAKLPRVVVLDPLEEYQGLRCRSIGALVSFMEEAHDRPRFRVVCTFGEDVDDYGIALDVCRAVGNLWVVVEEVNFFVDCWTRDKPFMDLVRFGRHDRVSMLLVAQRAAEIPKLYTSQSDVIVSFRQSEPRDLDYLSKVGHVGSAGAARIAALPRLKWPPPGGDLRPFYAVFRA
jgi:DNA helicase HerA-like ATPase